MGRDNNNAGMHLIRFSSYRYYDNLEYYDRLAVDEWRKKQQKIKEKEEKKRLEEQKKKAELETKMALNQKAEERKPKKKNNGQNDNNKIMRPKYGEEKVIPMRFFIEKDIVTRNMMIIALKKRLDIFKILEEAENMMSDDKRMNCEVAFNNSWSWMPMLDKSMVFLGIVAEKMECKLKDFFEDDSETTKAFIYELLENINDYEWDSGEFDNDEGSAEIRIEGYDYTFVDEYEINTNRIVDEMNLTIHKETIDNVPYYSLSYGSLLVRPINAFNYVSKGAYLWEEEDGLVKDTVERLIKIHPEWGDE